MMEAEKEEPSDVEGSERGEIEGGSFDLTLK